MKNDVRTKVLDYEANELPDGGLATMRDVMTFALGNSVQVRPYLSSDSP